MLLATACAPEENSAAPGGDGSGSAECEPGSLPTLAEGTLTIGTDSPAYPPWFVDDDPANGEGFESAVAYAVAEETERSVGHVERTVKMANDGLRNGPAS